MNSSDVLNIFSTDTKFWRKALGGAMEGNLVSVEGKAYGNSFRIELWKASDAHVIMRSYCTANVWDILDCSIDRDFPPGSIITSALVDAKNFPGLVAEAKRANWIISERLEDREAELSL
ncbi:MAG: hypothetical protein LBF42_04230 [Puniceicoccales bacterium]|jgi:hypothetical protein|nr:hypothetical protein [Puniceicoccales bacterium]